ncbi:MAG TPA: DedA family protein [Xanthobacteraceae bacterium]|jgi:membrane protein DedA with SNARE-associated domain|nr:DedA family protein [Xanthobacteraceae bacterium]
MAGFAQTVIAFVQNHRDWAAPIVFLLAFCESFAFVSLLVPATVILVGLGGLIGAAGLEFWPIWIAAALGAIAGDWLAYGLAFLLKDRITAMWPFFKYPKLLARGIDFFQRWGVIAVFAGRFFGPLRAIVPIVAGLYAMPWWKFQLANVASALLWATGILTPGFLSLRWLVG